MIVKLAWRNIWRNKRRSIITIVSILIAVFLSVSMRSMQLGMYDHMIKSIVASYSGYIQIHANGYMDQQTIDNSIEVNDDLLDSIANINGVNNIINRLQTFSLASSGDLTKGVLIQGVEIEKENLLVDWTTRLDTGVFFSNNNSDVILSKGVASYLQKGVGDTIIFIGMGYHGMSAAGMYKICGIVDMKNPKINNLTVFMSLQNAQEYLSAPNIVTHIIIDKEVKIDERKLSSSIKKELDNNQYEVMDWRELLPELEQTIKADNVGGLIMVFILYMIITFGIFGTVLMMTQERFYEFGVMISIGMKKLKLIKIVLLETITLSLIGVILGIFAALPIMYYFNIHPIKLASEQAEAMEKFGFEPIIPMSTNLEIPLTHAALIFCISLIISIYPVITILKLDTIKAMKN